MLDPHIYTELNLSFHIPEKYGKLTLELTISTTPGWAYDNPDHNLKPTHEYCDSCPKRLVCAVKPCQIAHCDARPRDRAKGCSRDNVWHVTGARCNGVSERGLAPSLLQQTEECPCVVVSKALACPVCATALASRVIRQGLSSWFENYKRGDLRAADTAFINDRLHGASLLGWYVSAAKLV